MNHTSAAISSGAAISRRRCVSMSCRNGNATPVPQAFPSAMDRIKQRHPGEQQKDDHDRRRRTPSSASPGQPCAAQQAVQRSTGHQRKIARTCCTDRPSRHQSQFQVECRLILNSGSSSQPGAFGSSIRSPVSSYVHGHPEFFQPFFSRSPVEDTVRILHGIAFHAVDDVVDSLESSLGEQVDSHGGPTARATHDHQRIVRRRDPLHTGHEVRQRTRRKLVLLRVPLVGHGDQRDLPRHRCVANPHELFGGPHIDDLHLVRRVPELLVGLPGRDIKAEERLLRLSEEPWSSQSSSVSVSSRRHFSERQADPDHRALLDEVEVHVVPVVAVLIVETDQPIAEEQACRLGGLPAQTRDQLVHEV